MKSELELNLKPEDNAAIRIVAIGASAGGLEPLEEFFKTMPAASGYAFVVIQHLSPDFRSMMGELIARYSSMEVLHAENDLVIRPNTIYLNLPRTNLKIHDGKFICTTVTRTNTLNLPIDIFMRSLAQEQKHKAIAIVMSGTGSDGSLGTEAIKKAGGIVIAQDPSSAKFAAMPQSVISRDISDIITVPASMPKLLIDISNGKLPEIEDVPTAAQPLIENPASQIITLLCDRYDVDFSHYKENMVKKHIKQRVELSNVSDMQSYVQRLETDTIEIEALFHDLLIGVTSFFRDPEAYEVIKKEVIPKIVSDMSVTKQVRIWIPACATGEEAYSLAILISEYAKAQNCLLNIRIFATDVNPYFINIARQGNYSDDALKALDDMLIKKYFERKGKYFVVKKSLKELIVFSTHNLLKDPPFTRIDLISCRNLLIYLNESSQKNILTLFHFALSHDGFLCLGPGETVGKLCNDFNQIDQKWSIYSKVSTHKFLITPGKEAYDPALPEKQSLKRIHKTDHTDNNVAFNQTYLTKLIPPSYSQKSLVKTLETILLEYVPSAILIDANAQLLHVFGNASQFLQINSGSFSNKVTEMVDKQLKLIIQIGLERYYNQQQNSYVNDFVFNNMYHEPCQYDVEVKAINIQQDKDGLFLVLFSKKDKATKQAELAEGTQGVEPVLPPLPVKEIHMLWERNTALERELHRLRENLHNTIEELETSNAELQATNEELMSSNEELQTTNEELNSVNEELFTVSAEHQRKITQLTDLTNDMDNLLRSTEIGTLFLDKALCIRSFTPAIARTFNLLPQDVGRPIDHVTSRFDYQTLIEDISASITQRHLIEQEVEVGNYSFLLRILPYYTDNNDVEGAVLTLIDVTKLKKVEGDVSTLKEIEKRLQSKNVELLQANENLEQFTYIVSHDLRAPLRAIKNTVKWIEEDADQYLNKELKQHLERLTDQSSRMSMMLSDLLAYSNLSASNNKQEMVDTKKLIQDIISYADYSKNIDLELDGEFPNFKTLKAPLLLIFQNLIDNAIKYNDKKEVKITILCTASEQFYEFKVTDNGPGILVEHHGKIFLPFRKLEHSDQKKGNGIGLALVKKAIVVHEGRIEVQSPVYNNAYGTCFCFTWPKHIS